jgi:hypothetical protein
MATLTYDPTPADQPEFTQAEQEALAVGEAQAAEEQQLLAGKFRDAEELEKAYIELQSKLGSRNNEEEVSEPETEEVETEPNVSLLDTLWEEAQTGELSDEVKQQLSQMNSVELAAEYLKYRQQVEANQPTVSDISEEDVNDLRGLVGGTEDYQNMIAWASENLSPEAIQRYDKVMASSDYDAMAFAVEALKSKYIESIGVEGQLFKGKPAASSKDVFRSQAEVVAAMADPRYDRDPAYRQDVYNKLERSEINY